MKFAARLMAMRKKGRGYEQSCEGVVQVRPFSTVHSTSLFRQFRVWGFVRLTNGWVWILQTIAKDLEQVDEERMVRHLVALVEYVRPRFAPGAFEEQSQTS